MLLHTVITSHASLRRTLGVIHVIDDLQLRDMLSRIGRFQKQTGRNIKCKDEATGIQGQ